MSHVTHARAFEALADPAVSIEEALRLFERAYKRSGPAMRDFVLDVTGQYRMARTADEQTEWRPS